MKEECLICKQPLEYLEEGILMECAICHKKENSKTRCVNGHYVCSECHTKGMDIIIGLCLNEHSKNPIEIINDIIRGFKVKKYEICEDRAAAITRSILSANVGDIVAIIGKGAEKYNIDKDGYHYFNEKEIVKAALALRKRERICE